MSLSPDSAFTVGVDIGGTNIKIALVKGGPEVLSRGLLPMGSRDEPESVVAKISSAVRELCSQAHAAVPPVGIGCAGLIDAGQGTVRISPNLSMWRDVPLTSLLSSQLHVTVKLENDANVFSLAEGFYGAARDSENAVFITLGTGVGGGLKLRGEMYTGTCGFAGEIGHVTIDPDGPVCSCGNRGCLESFAGSARIVNRARTFIEEEGRQKEWLAKGVASLDELTTRDLGEAAKNGDEIAKRAFAEAGEYIGIALAGVINLLNPEMAVIGGGVSNAGEPLLRPIRAAVTRRALAPSSKCVEIVPSRFGDDAGVIGAAMMVLTSEER